MKDTVKLGGEHFISDSRMTPQFSHFVDTFVREFRAALKKHGGTRVRIKAGHFEVSGFFTYKDKVFYISTGDVRDGIQSVMWRTAENYKDFTGGHNRFAAFDEDMVDSIMKDIVNTYG